MGGISTKATTTDLQIVPNTSSQAINQSSFEKNIVVTNNIANTSVITTTNNNNVNSQEKKVNPMPEMKSESRMDIKLYKTPLNIFSCGKISFTFLTRSMIEKGPISVELACPYNPNKVWSGKISYNMKEILLTLNRDGPSIYSPCHVSAIVHKVGTSYHNDLQFPNTNICGYYYESSHVTLPNEWFNSTIVDIEMDFFISYITNMRYLTLIT